MNKLVEAPSHLYGQLPYVRPFIHPFILKIHSLIIYRSSEKQYTLKTKLLSKVPHGQLHPTLFLIVFPFFRLQLKLGQILTCWNFIRQLQLCNYDEHDNSHFQCAICMSVQLSRKVNKYCEHRRMFFLVAKRPQQISLSYVRISNMISSLCAYRFLKT